MNCKKRFAVWLLLPVLLLAACSRRHEAAAGSGLRVVTTVAPLTNIVKNVGGTRVNVTGLIPDGTDSHTFEPGPADAEILSHADVIFVNGLHLETPTERLARQSMRQDAELYPLGDHAITQQDWIYDFWFPRDRGNPNPHLWMNPINARRYAELVHDVLLAHDPQDKIWFDTNLAHFVDRVTKLDVAIKSAIDTVPPGNRKLVTYHDSFAYFAPRYGMQVIGAVQPADFKEPSPREVATIIDQLRREHVPAIFGSEVFPSKVLDEMAKEAGVHYVSTLRDDDLPGAVNAPQHTYLGMMLEDVRTMVTSLGGDAHALDTVSPENTYR
ncbi:MAG: metal ABC transporter substrate-binding protein [Candidatus Xenobia bacterium]